MVQHSREEKKNQVIQKRAELEAKLEKIRQHELKVRDRQENGPPLTKKRKLDDDSGKDVDIVDEEQFALDDYESDNEGTKSSKANNGDADLGLSKETQALMQKLGYGLSALPKPEDLEAEDELKIYFCSRTHSQLSQFVNELKRIDLPAALPAVQEEIKKKDKLYEELKHLSLGARKNLCINSKVSSLKSTTAINERCLELQDAKTPKEKKCPFVPNKENEGTVLDFQHHTLAKIRDIEDLGSLGKKLGVCPYYATRPAVKPSEVRAIPTHLPFFLYCGPNDEFRLLHYHIHFYSKRRHEKHWVYRSRTTSSSSMKHTISWMQSLPSTLSKYHCNNCNSPELS